MRLTNKQKDDLEYRIRGIDMYLKRKENNLMSMVHPDWNMIKFYIKVLMEEYNREVE